MIIVMQANTTGTPVPITGC